MKACDHSKLTTAFCPKCGNRNVALDPKGPMGLLNHLRKVANNKISVADSAAQRGCDPEVCALQREEADRWASWHNWVAKKVKDERS